MSVSNIQQILNANLPNNGSVDYWQQIPGGVYVHRSMIYKKGQLQESYTDGVEDAVRIPYKKGMLVASIGPYNRKKLKYQYQKADGAYIERKATDKERHFYDVANKLNCI